MHISQFINSFICRWTFGQFLSIGHYDQCFCEHPCTRYFFPPLVLVYSFLGYIPMDGIAELYDNFMFNFLSNCQTLFPCLHHFTFLQAMHKYSNFSTLSAMFVICHSCELDRLMFHHQRFLSPSLGSLYISPHLTSSGKRDFSDTSSGN